MSVSIRTRSIRIYTTIIEVDFIQDMGLFGFANIDCRSHRALVIRVG